MAVFGVGGLETSYRDIFLDLANRADKQREMNTSFMKIQK
jgi:hypothetical protein